MSHEANWGSRGHFMEIDGVKIFSGKLKSRWSGPFTISQVFPYGTIELSQPDGPNFKVNGHRLKHYFGEDRKGQSVLLHSTTTQIMENDSKGEKIKESKLLIDELDLPCDFLPFEYDLFISEDFSKVDALPSTNNEDKVFNPGILSQEKPFEIITCVVQDKKLVTSNASSILEDFDPPLYEPIFFKEVPKSNMLLPFSSENEEKVFKTGIHTSKKFILLLS
uniref:Reverse transcriptase domain-containing protein n=1 Tax=Tanacetum cinerariifolium TaxID=118510 RepID=A0A699H875_TANCI|nr:reverse transcriptase domain-containing protein [Tanacetum cinerariifolium]